MKKACLILFSYIISVASAAAQTERSHTTGQQLDSIRKVYTNNKDRRLSIEANLEKQAQQTKDKELAAFVEMLMDIRQTKDHSASFEKFKDRVEEKYRAFPNIRAMCYQTIGYHHFLAEINYEKAFDAYLKLEKLLEVYPPGVISNYAEYCAEISSAYYKFKNYKKAISLGKKGVIMAKNKWDFYNTIGLCFIELQQIDSAIYYLQKAVDEAVAKKAPDIFRTISLGNIGHGYYKRQQYDKAKPLLQIDLSGALHIQDHGLAAGAEIPLADIYLKEEKWETANQLLQNARKHIAQSQQLDRLEKFFPIRSKYYQLVGNSALALAYRDSTIGAIKRNDSIYNGLLVMRIQQRADLENLNEEKNKLESYKKVTQTRTMAIIVVFIILAIVILIVRHYRNRIEKDKKRIAELNRIMELRQKLSADMHDDIGSTLSSISLYTQSLLMQPQGDVQKNTLEKIKQNAQDVQESIGDIIWSVNPNMDLMDQVIARMRAFGADMTEHTGISFHFNTDIEGDMQAWDMDVRKNLYLIYKEAVNNAVKYSNCKQLTVTLSHNVEDFMMEIVDDGIGFDATTKHGGNGLSNMYRRAEEIGGQLRILSKKDVGTTVALRIRAIQYS